MSDAFQNDLLAEETHSGRAWSLIILLALIGPMIGVALMPSTVGRWAVVLVGVIAIGAFAMSWSGFQYRFLRNGVEVRMLGFRLRSIPKQSIVSYSIEPWALFAATGFVASAARKLTSGATRSCISKLRMARFFWDTATRNALCAIWTW